MTLYSKLEKHLPRGKDNDWDEVSDSPLHAFQQGQEDGFNDCKAQYDEVLKMVVVDDVFINHIQSHLSDGEEVICKICGKTAKEIIANSLDIIKVVTHKNEQGG